MTRETGSVSFIAGRPKHACGGMVTTLHKTGKRFESCLLVWTSKGMEASAKKRDKKTKQDTLSRHAQPTLRPWQPIRMHQHTQEHVQDTVPQKKPTRIDPVHHHRLFLLGQGRRRRWSRLLLWHVKE